jgi:hypothetical protein
MGLFRDLSISNVVSQALAGLGSHVPWGVGDPPHTTSIAEARDRLGFECLASLSHEQGAWLCDLFADMSTWRTHETYVMDGSTLRTADTPENDAAFGRPGASGGRLAAFPQLRVVLLMAAGTHLIRRAAFGPYRVNELKIAEHMLDHLPRNALLLLDRAYHCYLWPAWIREREAHFVIRAKAEDRTVVRTRKISRLDRNDWLGELTIPVSTRKAYPQLPDAVPIRLITRRHRGRRITLITSLLSPKRYPADEIVDMYETRWEAELGYRELKTYLGEHGAPLRCKRPRRVAQEAHGLVVAYNCVRGLMSVAAAKHQVRPLELSFVDALERVRHAVLAGPATAGQQATLVAKISRCQLEPKRVGRSCPRGVKVRSSRYPRKRSSTSLPTLTRRQRQRRTVEEVRAARLGKPVKRARLAC